MSPRVFNLLTALSMVVSVALVPLWCGRTITLNLRRSSTEIVARDRGVYWEYFSSDEYHGTLSFFVSDPHALTAIFGNAVLEERPEYARVRANHPSGMWFGSEFTGQDHDHVGWFSLPFASAIAAACPVLWVILRSREFLRRNKNRRGNFSVRLRRLLTGLSLTACLIFALLWFASRRGYASSLGWGWLLQTQPDQCALTLRVNWHRQESAAADLWGNWYWVEPQYWSINPGVTGFHFERVSAAPKSASLFNDDTGKDAVQSVPSGFCLTVPDWFLCLITALLPLWTMLAWMGRGVRGRYRLSRGCCIHCGYDLRATTDRCPECGSHDRTTS